MRQSVFSVYEGLPQTLINHYVDKCLQQRMFDKVTRVLCTNQYPQHSQWNSM